jgi:ABC-2 type transport system permease protein
MTGLRAFLGKEVTEIVRTWRLWVIPGMLVFFGLTSPIIAALTPALVTSMASSQPGVVIKLPPPTSFDAYAQFIKNLDQFVLIAIVISGAGVVSGERSSGTAILALTKPLSRGAFVGAKMLAQVLLLVAATVLGTAVCLVMTAVVFDASLTDRLIAAVSFWLLYATLLVVVMTLFSAAFRSRGAAAGAGLAFYFLVLLLSNWGPAARYGFFGLIRAIRDALMGEPLSAGWPVVTSVIVVAAGVFASVKIFERQEL